MYPLKNKLRAFTIVEAIVGMLVTAIILTVVFVIFSFTSQRVDDFRIQNEGIADLNRMCYSLNKEIFESSKMEISFSNTVVFTDYKENEIRYSANKDYFVRTSGAFVDTFHLQTKKIVIEELPSKNNSCRFQRLRWELWINGERSDMFFYKKKYPEELLKHSENEF